MSPKNLILALFDFVRLDRKVKRFWKQEARRG